MSSICLHTNQKQVQNFDERKEKKRAGRCRGCHCCLQGLSLIISIDTSKLRGFLEKSVRMLFSCTAHDILPTSRQSFPVPPFPSSCSFWLIVELLGPSKGAFVLLTTPQNATAQWWELLLIGYISCSARRHRLTVIAVSTMYTSMDFSGC